MLLFILQVHYYRNYCLVRKNACSSYINLIDRNVSKCKYNSSDKCIYRIYESKSEQAYRLKANLSSLINFINDIDTIHILIFSSYLFI